jgi:AAA ATPase domain
MPQAMTNPAQELIGRHGEVERLNALGNRLHEGGGALVISGDAGIGKSAMLGHVREQAQAANFTVLATTGAEDAWIDAPSGGAFGDVMYTRSVQLVGPRTPPSPLCYCATARQSGRSGVLGTPPGQPRTAGLHDG